MGASAAFCFLRFLPERGAAGMRTACDQSANLLLSPQSLFYTCLHSEHSCMNSRHANSITCQLMLWGVGQITCQGSSVRRLLVVQLQQGTFDSSRGERLHSAQASLHG